MNRRLHTTTSGVLLGAVPVPWAVASWVHEGTVLEAPLWVRILLTAATLALAVAGLVIGRFPRTGRGLATFGAAAAMAIALPSLERSPALTVVLGTAAAVGLAALWKIGAPLFFSTSRGFLAPGRVRGSAGVALGFWLVAVLGGAELPDDVWAAVGVAALIAGLLGGVAVVRRRRLADPRSRALAGILVATASLAAFALDDVQSLATCGAFYALAALVLGPRTDDAEELDGRWLTAVLEHPERLLVTTFATLAGLGTLILALPHSAAKVQGIGGLDAAFTAVSAVCVTGLAVRDTAVEFSAFGQVAILILIQLGGLGIMTFSTAALRVLGGRMSLRQESAVATIIGAKDRSRVIASAQDVLRVTFLAEGVGAIVLAVLFVGAGDPLGEAIWRGCFTSISAYCNAGFALQSDSLVPYQATPLVLHTVAVLIVLGGLSPAVILALTARRGGRPLSLHARLCALSAVILLVTGFGFYLMAEWDHSLATLPLGDKLHNAWFQSVTLRTAGFNSVDIAGVHPATYVLMLGWMFVGASPGGTAGGIKTTTVAVLLLAVAHTIRGGTEIKVFGRRVPEATVRRAAAIVTVALLANVLAVVALVLTQRIPLQAAAFEAVSALGTVGLTQGATARLDEVGRVIVIVCMFVGRIGGLTMMMFMSQRSVAERIVLPIEDVDVG
ncbi:MAG: potassium transporter TrkH [Planctomycetes bacterium]|nr:potassium transporter TrkH [Planctomycetota bacterium]